MEAKCLNCGSDNVGKWDSGPYCRCNECGTMFDAVGRSWVPRRSQPATVLELPDADGYWWWWDQSEKWWRIVHCTKMSHRGTGRYVRALEPIVEPEPVDADAEWLRQVAAWCNMETQKWPGSRGEMSGELRRIADRLESHAKEPR